MQPWVSSPEYFDAVRKMVCRLRSSALKSDEVVRSRILVFWQGMRTLPKLRNIAMRSCHTSSLPCCVDRGSIRKKIRHLNQQILCWKILHQKILLLRKIPVFLRHLVELSSKPSSKSSQALSSSISSGVAPNLVIALLRFSFALANLSC